MNQKEEKLYELPEWVKLVNRLLNKGEFDRGSGKLVFELEARSFQSRNRSLQYVSERDKQGE